MLSQEISRRKFLYLLAAGPTAFAAACSQEVIVVPQSFVDTYKDQDCQTTILSTQVIKVSDHYSLETVYCGQTASYLLVANDKSGDPTQNLLGNISPNIANPQNSVYEFIPDITQANRVGVHFTLTNGVISDPRVGPPDLRYP